MARIDHRYTSRALKRALETYKAANPKPDSVTSNLIIQGTPADPKWVVQVIVDFQLTGGDYIVLTFADENGKVKKFATIDAVVKALSQVDEAGDGQYAIGSIETGAFFSSNVPADVYRDAENKVVKLTKVAVAQTAKRGALADLIGEGGAYFGWNAGNAAQRARYAETQAQIVSLDADSVAIMAEITRLNALIDSKP